MTKQVLGGSCSPARSVPLLTVLWFACLWHENSYVASGELNIDLFLHKNFSFYFLSEKNDMLATTNSGYFGFCLFCFVCFSLFLVLFLFLFCLV